MEGLSLFTAGLGTIFSSPKYLLLVFAFVAIGILSGAMPGISVNLSLILCLPMTYGMDSQTAMTVLIACYVGALSGGLISAIALNIPGTTSSIATCFDGHPLGFAKNLGTRANNTYPQEWRIRMEADESRYEPIWK